MIQISSYRFDTLPTRIDVISTITIRSFIDSSSINAIIIA